MLQRFCFAAMAALSVGGLAICASGAEEAAPEKVLVPRITSVVLEVGDPHDGEVLILVEGEVATSGYSDPELIPLSYTGLPKDYIQGFQFKVKPPIGPTTQVVTTVKAEYRWKKTREESRWIKGWRVEGVGDGIVERIFNDDRSRMFVGESKSRDFEEALNNALEELRKAANDGTAADAMVDWEVVKTSGRMGGLAGVNTLTVTISAVRTPDWPKVEAVEN